MAKRTGGLASWAGEVKTPRQAIPQNREMIFFMFGIGCVNKSEIGAQGNHREDAFFGEVSRLF